MRILLIEDDKLAAKNLQLILKEEGFVVDCVRLGEEGLQIGHIYDYDLIILDIMLPDIDGYEVLQRLRLKRIRAPVLILSGLSQISNKVKGLGFGADDYLTKPFHKEELLARVNSLIRRDKGYEKPIISMGKLSLDLQAQTAFYDGKPIVLTTKEYATLELLILRKGTTLTKEVFLSHLYGGVDEPHLKIIDVFICKLRRKLAKMSGGHNYIVTVWGRGYIFKEHPILKSKNLPA